MSNPDNSNDFLRDLLGDDLYAELKEESSAAPVDIPPQPENSAPDLSEPELPLQDEEDSDLKIYDKAALAENRKNLKVQYAGEDELSFVTSYYDDKTEADDADDEEDHRRPRRERRSIPTSIRALLYVVCVVAASIVLAVFVWAAADDVLALTGEDEVVSFTVTDLDSMGSISRRLKEQDLIKYPWLFRLYGWFSNADEKIETGTFELNKVYDYRALVLGMVNYDAGREIVTVVIPEGYEQQQIFELLEENGVATVSELSQTAASYDFDYYFLENLELGVYNRLEGYLFPDTYDFYVDEDPESVINKFLANFNRKFDEDLVSRIDALNAYIEDKIMETYEGHYPEEELAAYVEEHMVDMHDVVIIASLIEKEAANNSERSKISSVIHNRLISKLYPTLKIDATIQYILAERKEVLTYDDLSIDSPYNTYKNAGLTIGPIANPGLASIRAALYPDDTDYYFYALDTDGSHHFSRTSEEHTEFLLSLEQEETDVE